MKLIDKFDDFLKSAVNLNQTRIDTLDSRVVAIESFITASDYEPKIRGFSTQGSYAHKTIIKPARNNNEFDADMVMFIKAVNTWEPRDYIENLYKVFHENGTYRDKAGRKSRCVTIDYAADFHLDVVPIIGTHPARDAVSFDRLCGCR